ncbi:MAG: SDR family NAD(P)-dependent oxidoreductase [Saprospiraceae bacterium]
MKILVTGGTGFLGSYLLRYLVKKGADIRATRRTNSSMKLVENIKNKVEWVEADVLDVISLEDAMEGIDCIYHCAAIVSFDPKEAEMLHLINVEGTANVVNMALRTGVKRLLHVSSIAAIGRSKETPNVNENIMFVRNPMNTKYAISKFQGEQEAWRGAAEGLEVVVVNPSVIIGSGFWDNGTNGFFHQINNRLKFYPIGATGFVDVRDVAKAMIQIMDSNITDERYILNAENIPYQTFLNWIAENLEQPKPSIKVTKFIQELAWRLAWIGSKLTGKKPFLTKESARSSGTTFRYENDKFLNEFPNFEFRSMRKTTHETALQYKVDMKNGKDFNILPI